MPLQLHRVGRSLRFRLVVTAGVVLLLLLTTLVVVSLRLTERHLIERETQHLRDIELVFASTLAQPLAQREPAAFDAVVKRLREELRLEYVVLVDAEQQVLAVRGWEVSTPLPPRDGELRELSRGANVFHGMTTLRSEGRAVGYVLFGAGTEVLRKARAQLGWQTIGLALAAFLGSIAMLALIASWVTRDLRALEAGAAAIEQGQMHVKLPLRSQDEIGALTLAFNAMAQRLDERLDALKRSEARFHAIADYTYGIEGWFNPRGRLIWVNRSVQRVTGYTSLECILATNLVETLVDPKDQKRVAEEARRAAKGGSGENLEMRLKRKDGTIIWVALNWQPIFNAEGEHLGVRVSADEIQARKAAELKLLETVAELRSAQAQKEYYLQRSDEERRRLEALLNVMKVGVLFVDRDRRVLFCNKVLLRIWGMDENENLTGVNDEALLNHTAHQRLDEAAYRRHMAEVLQLRGTSEPFEFRLKDGRVISDMTALVPSADPGRPIGRVWIYEDITEQKRAEERLTQLAERDPLTDLYNRRRFHEELGRMLADAGRRKAQLGLLVIDLDGFKPINDEFGHQAGDEVLVTLARSVGATIRRNELFFRLGGDEFAVLAPDSGEADMVGLARRVSARIAEMRFNFGGREVRLTASLGIAIYPTHAFSGQEMVARADHAMYEAKASGRNCWQVYRDPTLH
jgi:diguanylate cyclase (GGDEF)-like protein/PAS domain S-box-containing protein